MKTIIILLLLAPLSLTAQTKVTPTKTNVVPRKNIEITKEKPVSLIRGTNKIGPPLAIITNPKFPGGMSALDAHVKSNFKISRKDRKNEVEGEIQVKFTVMADGSLKEIKVLNGGMSEKLNKEALKVISKLPNWTAGTSNGKAVDVMYVYSIKVGK